MLYLCYNGYTWPKFAAGGFLCRANNGKSDVSGTDLEDNGDVCIVLLVWLSLDQKASTRSIGRVWTRGYYLDTGSVSSSWDWMLKTEHTTPAKQSLADLSRNASVISNSSTDSEQELTPPRPRPIRTFSAPRSRSPQSPATTRGASRPPPSYLSRELGYEESSPSPAVSNGKPASKPSGKPSLQDFQFGRTLGEGSYSTVNVPVDCPLCIHINLLLQGEAWDLSH
jgi:hypothetical protein